MFRVTRSNLVTVVSLLVVVGSVGVLSATIDGVALVEYPESGEEPDILEPGASNGSSADSVSNGAGGGTVSNQIDLQFCVAILRTAPAILGLLGAVLLLLYAVGHWYTKSTAALASAGVLPVVMLGYFLFTNCPTQESGGDGLLSGSDVLGSAGQVGTAPSVPPGILAVVVVGIMFLAVGTLFAMTGQAESFEAMETEDDEEFDVDSGAFARSAGHAADRIEESNAPVDNAVYQAWLEMTNLLEIESPETAPPARFADRAIETGIEERTVRELTDLFRDVRYGGKDVGAREDRAVEILRALEQTGQESAGRFRTDETDAESDER